MRSSIHPRLGAATPRALLIVLLASTEPPSDAVDQAHRELRNLARLAHRERTKWLRAQYDQDEQVRRSAYAAYAEAAAAAAGTPEFGWLGQEALVAKYGEKEWSELLATARRKKLERYGAEGVSDLGNQGHAAAAAKQPYGAAGLSRKAGTARALKQGYHVRYAGVRWQKRQDRKTGKVVADENDGFWRCSFSHRGKRYSVGCFDTEEEAARAHDAFVRRRGLERELHFPDDVDVDDHARDERSPSE